MPDPTQDQNQDASGADQTPQSTVVDQTATPVVSPITETPAAEDDATPSSTEPTVVQAVQTQPKPGTQPAQIPEQHKRIIPAQKAVVTPAAPVTQPVVDATAAVPVVAAAAPVTQTSTALGLFDTLITSAQSPVLVTTYRNNLATYIEQMRPGKVLNRTDATRQQQTLYATIIGICNRLQNDFRPAWAALLALFLEQRNGVFHERYVNRFMDNVNLSSTERAAFQNLLNLIRVTADPKGRAQGLKMIDFQRSTSLQLSDQGKDQLAKFYGL